MDKCPMTGEKPGCSACDYGKEGLCDYPWVGDQKARPIGIKEG